MNWEKIAKFLSIILGLHFWFPALLIIGLIKSNLPDAKIAILFPALFLLQIIIPIAYIHIALHFKKVSNWDLPKKEERIFFLSMSMIAYLISMIIIYFLGNQFLFNLGLIVFTILTVMVITTYFWQISLHTALNTAGSIIINFLFNWSAPWLYLSIPIIFWARFKLKRHNPAQLFAGIILSGGITLGMLKFFKSI